jgi:hypothetical protein
MRVVSQEMARVLMLLELEPAETCAKRLRL